MNYQLLTERISFSTETSVANLACIMFKNYAWESVSAAAYSLSKERKSIREKRKRGVFQEISLEEFNDFVGIKITNANAEGFFKDKPQELQTLKKDLGLR